MNTHYAVITFSGDPAEEHADPDLNGMAPHLQFIAAGDEDFCWKALDEWTAKHPLQEWQDCEVLMRDPELVSAQFNAARIGVALLGEVPECNGVCGMQGWGDSDDRFAYDRDCPIHGDFADNQEAPPAGDGKDVTPPAEVETDTTREDTAR